MDHTSLASKHQLEFEPRRNPLRFFKYKCLWGVEGKNRDSNLQEGISYTYKLKLDYGKIKFLFFI